MNNGLSLSVAPSPHLRSKSEVGSAMRDVMIALIPISAVAVYFFGVNAIFTIAICMVSAQLTEWAFRAMLGRKSKGFDGSALLTGLLIALCFTVNTSWWTLVIACIIGVGIAKELMGGIGWNRFNPALVGRVSAVILAPLFLNAVNTAFSPLGFNLAPVDVVTQATPLALIKMGAEMPALGQMFVAFPGGGLAEVSPLALLIGGAFLLFRGHIKWHIPVSIIATVFVLGLLFGGGAQMGLYHLFAGGLMLGAIYMATDWVTSPVTPKGMIVFGVAIGILIMVFRLFLSPTEGTAFSILIMNAFVPMIDRLTKRPVFGAVPVKAEAALAAKPAEKTA
ncbi:MAG: RnfABCDGE type electron transport complex subunit D [Dethiobacteria bacterium]|nr:RnfABCDGE type electron transport complex subunit D [Dethiobacteria bacterium]